MTAQQITNYQLYLKTTIYYQRKTVSMGKFGGGQKIHNSSNQNIFWVVADLLKLPFSLYSVNLGLPIKYQMTAQQITNYPNTKNMSLEEN